MTLKSGTRLGPYEILSPLGAGGMGEVYRAADSKLRRDVAIKVLPAAFSADPERLARFEQEARLLAALNHPNIAGIYGLEESDGVRFLALELVPGETLAERVARGPVPAQEALGLSRQIAEALEAAHEKGIVHRDLKPANVKVTPDGQVKVLDFGLAKAFGAAVPGGEASPGGGVVDLSHSPTATYRGSREGIILGTAGYMSPEQARGKPVDRRTDIWAFGCVLYEMLTGRLAFQGETLSDTIAKILEREPEWPALPAALPGRVRDLLRRCLEKDHKRRLRDIGDARLEILEIEEASSGRRPAGSADSGQTGVVQSGAGTGALRSRSVSLGALLGIAAAAALAATVATWFFSAPRDSTPRQVTRFSVELAGSEQLPLDAGPAVALSPDGRRLVYVAVRDGVSRLYLREMDALDAALLSGTEGAQGPFFSPDGEWVGFFAGVKLKKVSITGGSPVALADTLESRGASWRADGAIVFSPDAAEGLVSVAAAGAAAPRSVSVPDRGKGERTHRWPQVLPGERGIIYTIGKLDSPDFYDDAQIAVQMPGTGESRILVEGASMARYLDPGYLIYARAGTLMAVPFELDRLEVSGVPVSVLDGVATDTTTGAAHYGVSGNGSLAYVPGTSTFLNSTLVWVDRAGKIEPLLDTPRFYREPRFSPDGARLAVSLYGSRANIWVHDLIRGTFTLVTSGGGEGFPVWTPDGRRILFSAGRGGRANIYWKPADGSGEEERLTTSEYYQEPGSVSPDGRLLVFVEAANETGADLWLLPLEGERRPRLFLRTPFMEYSPRFSPDGKWIAFTSNRSGRFEAYVRPYPGPGVEWQVSNEGGMHPSWSPDGRELYYAESNRLMVVAVQTRPSFSVSRPRALFEMKFAIGAAAGSRYSIAPEGRRFVMIQPHEAPVPPTRINVILNWAEELERRVPRGAN